MASIYKSCNLYEDHFKNKNPKTAATKNKKRLEDCKKKRQTLHFDKRNINVENSPIIEKEGGHLEVDERQRKLIEWKEEKRKREEILKKKAKPVFKVGIVTHKVGSPFFQVFNDRPKTFKKIGLHKFKFQLSSAKLTNPVAPSFITDNTNRRVLRSAAVKANKITSTQTLNTVSKKLLKTKADLISMSGIKNSPRKVLNEIGNTPTRKTIKNSKFELSTKQIVFSPISPNVCITRGKTRSSFKFSDDDSDDAAAERQLLKEKKSSQRIAAVHFERLDDETKRLHERCNQWNQLLEEEKLPEDIIGEINALDGKTRLLTSDKFMQFRRLVENFEHGNAKPLITADDLTGFWDLVYIQVEDIDSKFNKLENLKLNGWKHENQASTKQKSAITRKKASSSGVIKPKSMTSVPKSSLKNFIAAARINKQISMDISSAESKTFDAVSFKVISPISSPVQRKTDINSSLLKQVLTSASKRNSCQLSAANVLRKSVMARSVASSPTIVMQSDFNSPRSILRKPSTLIKTNSSEPKRKLKSLRFRSSDEKVTVEEKRDTFSVSIEEQEDKSKNLELVTTPETKTKRRKATPARRISLNETFSMDENEDEASPDEKTSSELENVMPGFDEPKCLNEEENKMSLNVNIIKNETFTPRRSTRLAEKGIITPVSVLNVTQEPVKIRSVRKSRRLLNKSTESCSSSPAVEFNKSILRPSILTETAQRVTRNACKLLDQS